MLREITPLHFFSWNFVFFQQKEPIKVQIWRSFKWTVESLKFCTLMVCLSKSYKVSVKRLQKSYLSWHWSVMLNLKINWLLVSNTTQGICWIFTQQLKSLKILLDGLFCPKYARFELKKYRGVIFYDTEQWCKIWINPEFVVSKIAWGIGCTLIRVLESLKHCTLMGSFCLKHMFQLENYRGIMYNGPEGCCKT